MASYHKLSTLEVESSIDSDNKIEYESQNVGENGASLTWQDLSVTVYDRANGKNKSILEDVTGYAIPGQFLAILGPSGCGKTTLLDALAGRLDSRTKQTGQILINGYKQSLAYGTSAYVTQDDILMSTLTVRETMYYSSELQLPSFMSKIEKRKRAEECIIEMGLQNAIDTRVGRWGVKGLSGGEKKRLSICIEIITRPRLLFLDEPTSGLDSAAAFYVMSRVVSKERTFGRTIVASIHQPSSQVFELFDNLCLLSVGKTVYFGPAREANEFFASNGFPCPSLRNPADHFLQMINTDFDEDIDQKQSSRKPVKDIINNLLKSYNSSESCEKVQFVINSIIKQEGKRLEIERRPTSFFTQCQVLIRRSFVNMSRDWGYYWLRLTIYVILGLGLGQLFFDLGVTFGSIQVRIGLLMFLITYKFLLATSGFLSFIEEMKVFKRERLNGHYSTSSFVLGNTFSSMPFVLLVSLIPGAITYYLTGFQRDYQNFVYFILAFYMGITLVESLVMVVATVIPNFLWGLLITAGIQALMALSLGFFRRPDDLPRFFWRYPLYYISFHRYAYEGLLKNEFEGLKIPIVIGTSKNIISGDSILKSVLQVETKYSKWMDLAILLGMVIIYRLLFIIIVTASEKHKPLFRNIFNGKITKKSK